MKKWEYRKLEVRAADFWDWSGRIPDSCIYELNRSGAEGWEVVQVIPLARAFGRTDYVTFILKREVT